MIEKLKIGDKVITIERYGNTIWKWESIITKIETNYIETEYCRDIYNKELGELVARLLNERKLLSYHRTYGKQIVKNYFGPNGEINIELI